MPDRLGMAPVRERSCGRKTCMKNVLGLAVLTALLLPIAGIAGAQSFPAAPPVSAVYDAVIESTALAELHALAQKAGGRYIGADVIAPAVPSPVIREFPAQDPALLFRRRRDALVKFERDTALLKTELAGLERNARGVKTAAEGLRLKNELRSTVAALALRAGEARRITADIKALAPLAVGDKELNGISRELQWRARNLENRFKAGVYNAAFSLELAVNRTPLQFVGSESRRLAAAIRQDCANIETAAGAMRVAAHILVSATVLPPVDGKATVMPGSP